VSASGVQLVGTARWCSIDATGSQTARTLRNVKPAMTVNACDFECPDVWRCAAFECLFRADAAQDVAGLRRATAVCLVVSGYLQVRHCKRTATPQL
jgi:hypothetical protein